MTAPLEADTRVVLIKERAFDPSDGGPWPVGTQFTINEYVGAEESVDGKPMYWGNINEGACNIWAPADSIAVVANDVAIALQTSLDSPRRLSLAEFEPTTNVDVLREIRELANWHNFMVDSAATVSALLNLVRGSESPTVWGEGLLTLAEWEAMDYWGKNDRLDDARETCDAFDTADFAYGGRRRGRNDVAVRLPAKDTDHAWVIGRHDGTLMRIHAWDLWKMGYTPMWVEGGEVSQSPSTPQREACRNDIFSRDTIEAHLVFLDRAHKMTSSDHLTKETHYSKSAGMIRQLLASNGEIS